MKNKTIFLLIFIIVFTQIDIAISIEKFSKKRYILKNDFVNVRKEPNINSKILYQLNITDEITLLKKLGKRETINNLEGEWVFIDTKKYLNKEPNTIQGWVFDYFLTDGSDFHRINSFHECTIKYPAGDISVTYFFMKDGSFKAEHFNYYNFKKEEFYGALYKNDKLIIGRFNNSNDNIYFYLNVNNEICYYTICTICK